MLAKIMTTKSFFKVEWLLKLTISLLQVNERGEEKMLRLWLENPRV